jgi:hypothetical protein
MSHQSKEERNKYLAKYREKNKERENRRKNAWRQKVGRRETVEQMRIWKLWQKYRLPEKDYKRMLADQNGVCAICGEPETRMNNKGTGIRNLCVDHDHRTGEVRGLLCMTCNLFIGAIGERAQIARNVAKYLDRWSKKNDNG